MKESVTFDMNGTFMFGYDRFGPSEDFFEFYSTLGGKLDRLRINSVIRAIYEYLNDRYPNEKYRHNFPSVTQVLDAISDESYEDDEIQKIVSTFAHHELGYIPLAYASALHTLKGRFALGVVIDIWSPKAAWLDAFGQTGISALFDAASFSSDHGMVKPSPKPFEQVLNQLNIASRDALFVGDSPRRDLGGAKNAGIDCILVGGAKHPDALRSFGSLLELCELI